MKLATQVILPVETTGPLAIPAAPAAETTEGPRHDPAPLQDDDTLLIRLDHGASRADLALGIGNSPEAQSHLVGHIEQGWYLA